MRSLDAADRGQQVERIEFDSRVEHIANQVNQGTDVPVEDPGSPRAVARIYAFVTDTLPVWVLRPALYLYALLVPATLVQDVRFQYGVILTAVVLVPALLTVTPKTGPDDRAPLRWRSRSGDGHGATDNRDRPTRIGWSARASSSASPAESP